MFLLALSLLVATVSAHVQLHFPAPRGPFVANQEPTFCDGYTNAVDNRTQFPLNKGFITFKSGHPQWTMGVLISIDQNPTTFASFNKSSSGVSLPFAHPFFEASGAGEFCVSLDIASTNISGLTDGSNVTIQIEYDGGDGALFQCADITLSSSVQVPDVVNQNCTGNGATLVGDTLSPSAASEGLTATQGSATGSGSPAATSQSASSAEHVAVTGLAGFLVTFGALILGFL